MRISGQSSFRRILLSRILLFSIPILLLGVAVTFRKARTSLLYTARQNLTESAVRKSRTIRASVDSLRSSLAIASESHELQAGSPKVAHLFLLQLAAQLPTEVKCLQLTDLNTYRLIASTCGDYPITSVIADSSWPSQQNLSDPNRFQWHRLTVNTENQDEQIEQQSQLHLVLSTPVYDKAGQLRYSLTAESVVQQMESGEPWSLLGFTVVIDQEGTFLAHPFQDRVGRNITAEGDAARLEDILSNVRRETSDVRHLFDFDGNNTEWLAGFSPVTIPISATEEETWAVLAVTPLHNALQGLKAITQILVILTTGLLAAHLLAMLYMARDLSLPIEQLGKYARHIHRGGITGAVPKNFKIREINQLAEVLDNMVKRLEERAAELESAWQEADAANKLKSEFLANTSHELRTPLNAIIGCIRLVQDGCCDSREEEVEFLQQADKAAVHLLKIINDLLDIRRIEAEGIPLSIELIDLRQVLKEVVELQTVQIQQKGLQLNVPSLSAPLVVAADPARLKQILLNVIYNATKFTDEGSITIQTRIEPRGIESSSPTDSQDSADHSNTAPTPQPWVVISVQDTGIGIDPSQQHKLFRPFVMVDGTTTRKFEGTGLGLAISRNLVEMMGGQISLYSAGLDQGTSVELMLPLAEISSSHEPRSGLNPSSNGVMPNKQPIEPSPVS